MNMTPDHSALLVLRVLLRLGLIRFSGMVAQLA